MNTRRATNIPDLFKTRFQNFYMRYTDPNTKIITRDGCRLILGDIHLGMGIDTTVSREEIDNMLDSFATDPTKGITFDDLAYMIFKDEGSTGDSGQDTAYYLIPPELDEEDAAEIENAFFAAQKKLGYFGVLHQIQNARKMFAQVDKGLKGVLMEAEARALVRLLACDDGLLPDQLADAIAEFIKGPSGNIDRRSFDLYVLRCLGSA